MPEGAAWRHLLLEVVEPRQQAARPDELTGQKAQAERYHDDCRAWQND
jgi:hypothetical protein